MQSFPTHLILLGPAWKTHFHIIFSFSMLYFNSKDLNNLNKSLWFSWRWFCTAANIAEVKNVFTISDSKMRKQSTLSVQMFFFDNLCVPTPSLWSEGAPIAWTCHFCRMHPLIKDNSLQSKAHSKVWENFLHLKAL